ncbi:cation diffusion facilitator family transporter [Paenibacillus campi]|uniref:cation diffusion facilitator family transporter n=1 Tax=Paenibacillus campi TaxID=3106031 RepID=UPI002AFF3099|nr:cation diffusion facilitator family transporter [Paenibacillus sp. SGZ-1009]
MPSNTQNTTYSNEPSSNTSPTPSSTSTHDHEHFHDHDHSHDHPHQHTGKSAHKHSHGHGGHNHSHAHTSNKKSLTIAFFLIASFMVVEVIGGFVTNSLALLSDAGHMLSDTAALGLSLLAMIWGQRQASTSKTYGYKRFEVLAAFINGIALAVISLYIFWEAFQRFGNPPGVASTGMLIIAVIGLLVNIAAAYVLMRGEGSSDNLNMRSALLHVMGDMLGSVGAIAAALLIMAFGWNLADPIASVIVAVLVLFSAYRVTRDSIHILMEGTPVNIDTTQMTSDLKKIKHVLGVHDLHVWSLTSELPLLSCHLRIDNMAQGTAVLQAARTLLQAQYRIGHVTIQLETADIACTTNQH